jgi:Icc-related predicted phosphoesterase
MRILFVADLHGAGIIFKKSLKAVKTYGVSVLILAGDLTSKDIRPIISKKDGTFSVNYRDKNEVVTASEIKQIEEELSSTGHYFFHCKESEFESLKENRDEIFRIMDQKILERLETWSETIIKQIDLTQTTVFITPGNDDILEIDDLLKRFKHKGIHSNLFHPYIFPANEMITLDYCNQTPWDTPREATEKELAKMIKKKVKQLKEPGKAIFNFHCPPKDTRIDLAPELDKNLKPVIVPGVDAKIHVGSSSVRQFIEEYQPVLGLHGHVHESPGVEHIGNTVCLNPGSEYWNGILHGYIIEIDEAGNVAKYFHIEG